MCSTMYQTDIFKAQDTTVSTFAHPWGQDRLIHLRGWRTLQSTWWSTMGSRLTHTFDEAMDSTLSTVGHPQGQHWLTHLVSSTGMPWDPRLFGGEKAGKVKDYSVLPVFMFPVPGKMHVPTDSWDGCVVRLTCDINADREGHSSQMFFSQVDVQLL